MTFVLTIMRSVRVAGELDLGHDIAGIAGAWLALSLLAWALSPRTLAVPEKDPDYLDRCR